MINDYDLLVTSNDYSLGGENALSRWWRSPLYLRSSTWLFCFVLLGSRQGEVPAVATDEGWSGTSR